MSAGLQCFNADGKCIYDSNVYTGTYLGTFTISYSFKTEKTYGSYHDSRINGNKLWWYIESRTYVPNSSDWATSIIGVAFPNVRIYAEDSVIKWEIGSVVSTSASSETITIGYGTFV